MHPFNDIWNAATCCNSVCIVVIVGLISMIFGAYTDTEMMLCTDDSMPCVLTYGETMNVCDGDRAYANMTLRVGANISPNDITIMVQGHQFSKGPVVTGQFHNGDEQINRWTNKISFQGNTMTYEIWNLKTESGDEFECHMEIDIEGDKFISKHFKWFVVDSCTTRPSNIKDPKEQYLEILDNNTEQLDQLRASMNSLTSDVADLKNTHTHLESDLKDAAETTKEVKDFTISSVHQMTNKLNQILGLIIFLSIPYFLKIIKAVITFLYTLACKRDQPRAHINNYLPSFNNPQVLNTDDERSISLDLTVQNSPVRSQSMLSLRPQDEVQDEEETTGV